MRAEMVALNELKKFPQNPKGHDLGAVRVSIDTFGFIDRIVVNEVTGHMIAGHGRVEVLEQMLAQGEETPDGVEIVEGDDSNFDWLIPVDFVSVPVEKESAAVVALNRTVELGAWDDHVLVSLLQEIAEQDAELLATSGFDEDDLAEMLDNLNPSNGSSASPDPFGGFPNIDDGTILFRFGDYSGRVSKEVYDSFKKEFAQQQTENDAVIMDDVLRAWLHV